MNDESSITTQVAVSMLPKLNSFHYLPLIEECGGIEGFFRESTGVIEALYRTHNLPPNYFNRNQALDKASQELANIDKHQIRVCSIEHTEYPELLRQSSISPLVFFYKGTLKEPGNIKLSIVGTRHATARGEVYVDTIVNELYNMGHRPVITSGLAFGIDAAAHRASIAHNLKTYAVLGHGLHMIYPAAHKNLAARILETGGALITEFPCCAPILPANFLMRNRIIAALSQATLVAESADRGGAMTTARLALSFSRDVMAIPGRPEDKWSAGCNRLIKENVAALVENGTDVANILGISAEPQLPVQTSLDLFDAGENETIILKLLGDKSNLNIDEISATTHIPVNELSSIFLKLELEGKVSALPGKNYKLN